MNYLKDALPNFPETVKVMVVQKKNFIYFSRVLLRSFNDGGTAGMEKIWESSQVFENVSGKF